MKNRHPLKSLAAIILLVAISFTSIPTCAANINDDTHKQTIEQFLNEISIIQGQVAGIALSALKITPSESKQFQSRINLINNNIENLNTKIQEYFATVPDVSAQSKHVLLTFNVLNLVKSSLYSLNLLINSNTNTEKLELLDEYFRSRVAALDTVELLGEMLSK